MSSVKYFHSGLPGAPVLSGSAGALVGVLDACLVNGFGLGALDSLTVTSGVATAVRSAGHSFEQDTVALISGATPPELNGQKKVLSVTVNSYTFDATGVADGVATGTIEHRLAPAGWEIAHTGTNLRAYRSIDPASTFMFLRVDDTGATNARVVGYETMANVNDATGKAFPTAAQISGGGFWGKSNAADATARPWIVFADSRAFYLAVQWSGVVGFSTQTFGDFTELKSPDAYACSLSTVNASIVGFAPGSSGNDIAYVNNVTLADSSFIARGVSGLGAAVKNLRFAVSIIGGNQQGVFSGANNTNAAFYPNPADNGLYLSEMGLWDNNSFRGKIPGAYYVPQNVGTAVFVNRERLTGVTGYPGRAFRAVLNASGLMFFDVTGPWR
jgi:hypothetical protein